MSNQATALDQDFKATSTKRRQLLPWWMKMFSWLFMLLVLIIPFAFAASIFGFNSALELYGLSTHVPFSPPGFFLCALFLLKGIVGYGLWFEKDWAIIAGLVDAVSGIVIVLSVMVVFPMIESLQAYGSNFRLEILFLIFYLAKLITLKRQW